MKINFVALMMELVDMTDLKSVEHKVRVGSSPIQGTKVITKHVNIMTIDIKLLYVEIEKIRERNPFFTQRTAYDDGIISGINICCDKLELFLKHYEKFPEKYNVK